MSDGRSGKPIVLRQEDLMRNVVLEVVVKRTPQYRVRLWLAERLFWAIARLLGCGIEILEQA